MNQPSAQVGAPTHRPRLVHVGVSKLIAGTLAAAVLAVASVTLAAASPTTSADPHTVTIRVLEHQVDAAAVDVGTPGPSLGDRFVFTGDVFQNGKKVGFDGGSFEFVRL